MIRAFIREDFAGMSLAIALIQESEGLPRRILRIVEGGSNTVYQWEDLPDRPEPDIAPTFQLGDSEARAVLESLTRHYNGADDVRALRRDYDHERKRVDQLTATLGIIASDLANPVHEMKPPRGSEEDLQRAFKEQISRSAFQSRTTT